MHKRTRRTSTRWLAAELLQRLLAMADEVGDPLLPRMKAGG